MLAPILPAAHAELSVGRRHGEHEPGALLLSAARWAWKLGDSEGGRRHDPTNGLWCACEDWHMGEAPSTSRPVRRVAGRAGPLPRPGASTAPGRGVGPAAPSGGGRPGLRWEAVPRRRWWSHDGGAAAGSDGGDAGKAEPALPRGPARVTAGNASTLSDRRRGLLVRLRPRRRAVWRRRRWPAVVALRRAAWRPRDIFIARCWRCGGYWESGWKRRRGPYRTERGVRGPDAGVRQGTAVGRGEGERPRRGGGAGAIRSGVGGAGLGRRCCTALERPMGCGRGVASLWPGRRQRGGRWPVGSVG